MRDNILQFDLWQCKACKAYFLFDFDSNKGVVEVIFACPVCGEEEATYEDLPNQGLRQLRRVFVDAQIISTSLESHKTQEE